MSNLESMLEEFIMPYSHLLNDIKVNPSLSTIKQAIATVNTYFYSDDIPHDKGLHIVYLDELKTEIETNFPKEKYPEYYL